MEKVFIVRSYFYDRLICMYFVICFYILEEVHFLTIVSVEFQHNPEWLNKQVLFLKNVPYFTLSVDEWELW